MLSKEYYVKTVSDGEPSDEENDLLDLACAKLRSAAAAASRVRCSYGLTETSRLGCQVKLTPQMNGMQVVECWLSPTPPP